MQFFSNCTDANDFSTLFFLTFKQFEKLWETWMKLWELWDISEGGIGFKGSFKNFESQKFWRSTYYNPLIRTYMDVSRGHSILMFKTFKLRHIWMIPTIMIKVGLPPSKKNSFYLLQWKPFKNDEKCSYRRNGLLER